MNQIYGFGHYEVAGKKYFNKLKAYESAFSIGHTPHWNFYEEEFSKFNWTIEPTQTLRELYADRARKIRESADYVILFFSGGSDSWTVANSFIDNGLLIDEMWSMAPVGWTQPGDKDTSCQNYANEIRHVCIPEAEKFLQRSPKTKYRVIDTSQAMIDYWSENTYDPENHNHFTAESPLREANNKFFSDSIPTTATKIRIVGIDKPRMVYRNNRFYFYFLDLIICSRLGQRVINIDPSDYDMAFFWNPQSALMLIKQGHIIKKWFKANPEYLYLLSLNQSMSETVLYQKIVNKLIYPDYNHDLWQVEKSTGLWDIEYYDVFARNDASTATQNWKKSIRYYSDAVYDMYRNNNRLDDPIVSIKNYGWYHTLPGCPSKFYDLGT